MEAAALKAFRIVGASEELVIRAEDVGEGDAKKTVKKFEGTAYTGAQMRLFGFYWPVVVDLAGLQAGNAKTPILRQHNPDRIVGHGEVEILATKVKVKGSMSGVGADCEEICATAAKGFPWQMSIGANATRMEFVDKDETVKVNGRSFAGPVYVARGTILGEVSFVPLGADGATSATVAASKSEATMFEQWLQACGIDASKLSPEARAKAEKRYNKMQAQFKTALNAADPGDEDDDEDDDAPKKTDAKALRDELTAGFAKMQADITAQMAAGRKEQDRQSALARLLAAEPNMTMEVEEGGVKKNVPLLQHAISAGWDAERLELQMHRLAEIRGSRPQGPHFYVPQQPVLNGAVLEAAVFDALPQFRLFDQDFYAHGDNKNQRRVPLREEKRITAELNQRYPDQVRQAAHTHFKGRIGLQQLLTTLAASKGYKGPSTFNDPSGWGEVAGYLAQPDIRADSSTINTPATLANVQNKFMLQGYMFTEQSFMEICSVLPVKDLKPTKSVQLFGDFVFKPLAPGGEMQHASVGDNPYANQAAIQARMITIDLQYIINDDLNMFGQVPMMLGRGWGLRVNDLVWTVVNNPGTDDGGSTDFFATTHTITGQSGNANYQSGGSTALQSSSLTSAKLLFDRQVDPAGKKLGVDAEILLYPPELDTAAIELMNSQFIIMAGLSSTSSASKQPSNNIWKGRFKPVMSRYLSDSSFTGYSTTAWYLLANPSVIPVFQIAALNGNMTPNIQTAGPDWQFNMLGITMRGWGGVGVAKQNFRGAVKSAGA